MRLGKKLKEMIERANCKQVELAEYLNISPSRLSNYLSDKREPHFTLLADIVDFLGTDLNTLSGRFFDGVPKYKNFDPVKFHTSDPRNSYVNSQEIISIPMATVNSKKKSINSTILPMSKHFMPKVENPNLNAMIFEVNIPIPDHIAKPNDYLICVRCEAITLKNGDKIMEHGRTMSFYRYFKDNDVIILLNEDKTKENIRINSDNDLKTFYKIMWILRSA